MLVEGLAKGVFELDGVAHRGVQRPQVGQRLLTHRLLDQVRLAELLAAQPSQDPLDLVVEVAAAPAADQRGPQRRPPQPLGRGSRSSGS